MKTEQFKLMIHQHSTALRAFAMKYTNDLDDAKDLVQDTMLKAMKYCEQFEQGSNLRSWLFAIMKNTFINNFRRNSRRNALMYAPDTAEVPLFMRGMASYPCEYKFVMQDIKKAISNIPPIYSTAFVRYFEGYKYYEIAEELNIPIGTVKTRIHEARRMLRLQLQTYQVNLN